MAVEDAAGSSVRIGEQVVPAGRRGAVALVVSFEVSRGGSDRAREAEARPDDTFEDRKRTGVRRDPERLFAVLRLYLLEFLRDRRGRFFPRDPFPLARAALADPLVRVLDPVRAVGVLDLGDTTEADARIELRRDIAADRLGCEGGARDQPDATVDDLDLVPAGTVAIVRVPGAKHRLLSEHVARLGGICVLQIAQPAADAEQPDPTGRPLNEPPPRDRVHISHQNLLLRTDQRLETSNSAERLSGSGNRHGFDSRPDRSRNPTAGFPHYGCGDSRWPTAARTGIVGACVGCDRVRRCFVRVRTAA